MVSCLKIRVGLLKNQQYFITVNIHPVHRNKLTVSQCSRSRVLEKAGVAQLLKKFPKFYGHRRFHIVQCWGPRPLLNTKIWRVMPLKTPFGIGNSFITISHVRNYTHNYLLRCFTFTQLAILHANVSFYSLTVFITHLTSSHLTFRNDLRQRTYS
jgi:hypothetical protein